MSTAEGPSPFGPSGEEYTDFVPVVFARSPEEAQRYQELLSDHDIPAMIGGDKDSDSDAAPCANPCSGGMSRGVPVMVPDVLLDEASEIIADREDVDEFALEEDEVEEEDDLLGLSPDIGSAGGAALDEEEDDFIDDEDDAE